MQIAIFVPAYSVGSHMGGIGVRAWELGQILASNAKVSIVARNESDFEVDGIEITAGGRNVWQPIVDDCDAAIFYDLPDTEIMLAAHRAGKLIISEAAIPIEHLQFDTIRNSETPDKSYADIVARFKLQVLLTDHFIIRSRIGFATLITALSMAGRLAYANYNLSATIRHLWTWIPIGYSSFSERHAKGSMADAEVVDFVWSGGIWDFYDPVAAVAAVAGLKQAGRRTTLRFMYKPPSDQKLEEATRLLSAIDEFGVGDLVDFCASPPAHYERDAVIRSARAGICIGKPGIENETSIRLRIRDAFLYQLPLVIDNHGATGRLVDSMGVGTTANSESVDEIAAAMWRLKADTNYYDRITGNLARVRTDYLLDPHVQRLGEVVRLGQKAPDIGDERHSRLVDSLVDAFPSLIKAPIYPY